MAFKTRLSGNEIKLVLVLAGIVSAYFFYSRADSLYRHNGAGSVEEKIESAQRRLDKSLEIIYQAEQAREEHQALLADYKQKGMDEAVMSAIISEVQAVSNQRNIRITDLKPNKVRRVEAFNRFSVSLAMEGNVTDVIQYIHTLQNPPHNFSIDEFHLRRILLKAKEVRCQAVFERMLLP